VTERVLELETCIHVHACTPFQSGEGAHIVTCCKCLVT